jgi:hypothetical protein
MAIDQERMMKAIAEVDEKNRKNMMHESHVLHGVYPTWGSAVSTTTAAELGQSPTIPTAAIPVEIAAIAVAIVQPCSYSTTTAGCH